MDNHRNDHRRHETIVLLPHDGEQVTWCDNDPRPEPPEPGEEAQTYIRADLVLKALSGDGATALRLCRIIVDTFPNETCPMTTTDTPPWQPIVTAPKKWEDELPFDLDGRKIIIRIGRDIMVRGTVRGETVEEIVHWAEAVGFRREVSPHWFNFDCEEPLDWDPVEWRELTDAEEATLIGDPS